MFVLQQQQNLGRRFGTSIMHLSPPPPPVDLAAVRSNAVVLLSFIVTPILGFCNFSSILAKIQFNIIYA